MSSILWLTWKDYKHPEAGGAEVVLRELSQRLVAEGHGVTFLTNGYGDAKPEERLDGIHIIRIGRSRYIHPFQAFAYYARRMRNAFDIVIEVVNTAPYFSAYAGGRGKKFLFYHQLAREVWLHETPTPMNYLGYYALEPVATRLLSLPRTPVITISDSTKRELMRYGFKEPAISIISEGIEIKPIERLQDAVKYDRPTLVSLGSIRPMKRTLEQIEAFELAKNNIPDLQLKVAGAASGRYGHKVLSAIRRSRYSKDIEYLGKISQAAKELLLRKSHLILVTSIKEGWGLIVTEAASQGTPAAVYNVDGLRDSVRDNETGTICSHNSPRKLAAKIEWLLADPKRYNTLRKNAWEWSKEINFESSYKQFKEVVGI